ncbi:hypothetical protein A2U01_0001196, partial [Trifolium medium]|nr:hypothetical protein [Trifolium medium]
MVEWPIPKNVKQLRGFLGLTGFYRKFVQHYAMLAAPLTALLKRNSFLWTNSAQQAFELLKVAMSEAPVLSLPNFEEQFVLETDASGAGMGAVLIQQGHPICYFSKQLCPQMLQASTYVRELCAIISAVKKWRTYLLGNTFIIYMDQRSLRELMTQVIQTPEQQFYLAKLLVYSYEIVQATPSDFKEFEYLNGLLFYKGKLFIPSASPLKLVLLEEFHGSTIGGHSGIHRTFGRLQENIFWHGMRQDVEKFVKACAIYQSLVGPFRPCGLCVNQS